MAVIRLRSQEIQCKVVYCGPCKSGKSTNLRAIARSLSDHVESGRDSMTTLADGAPDLDFLHMDLGCIEGLRVGISFYALPGHVRFRSTWKLMLHGLDGVVFVADSMAARRKSNLESLSILEANLKEYGKSIAGLPLVFQYNKRDLEDTNVALIPIPEMERCLNPQGNQLSIAASALNGTGVRETLDAITSITLQAVTAKLLHGEGIGSAQSRSNLPGTDGLPRRQAR